jgi:peroxiredoxin
MKPVPNQPAPALEVPTLDGGTYRLGAEAPERFTMLVFYRGLHCPICRRYLSELDGLAAEFGKRGVATLVLSSDTRERAEQARAGWGLKNLRLGYGLAIEAARAWGLYVSRGRGKTSIGVEEPAQFSEPGLFLVRPDGRLYWGSVSTMPFARPHFDEVLQAIDFVVAKDYPARGDA